MRSDPLVEPWRPDLATYHRMAEAGMFEDVRVELLDGVITEMSPAGRRHAQALSWLTRRVVEATEEPAFDVRVQMPLQLGVDWEPEPDLAVVGRSDARPYHPAGAALVCEVSETSLRRDRQVKAPIYAHAGIAELWIVDVHDLVLERHLHPTRRGYRTRLVERAGTVAATSVPRLAIHLDALWAATTEGEGPVA